MEELLKNASVEDFVETARSLSLEQYDGSMPFESHPETLAPLANFLSNVDKSV